MVRMLDFCLLIQYTSPLIQLLIKGLIIKGLQQQQTIVIVIGGMQQESQRVFLKAKIKCGVFKQLFNQIVKNIKNHKTFFMYTCKEGIQMIFMESDKQVQIKAFLSNKMFMPYQWVGQSPHIFSFDIKDLQILGAVFDNAGIFLTLYFRQSSLNISYESQFSGATNYFVNALAVNEADIPQQVGRIQLFQQQIRQRCTQIRIPKAKLFANYLHTLGLSKKYEEIQIKFESSRNKLSIMPVPINCNSNVELQFSDMTQKIDVKYQRSVQHDRPIRFFLRKLKAGLVLFDKNSELSMTFFSDCVKIESAVKDIRDRKNVVIMIACAAQ